MSGNGKPGRPPSEPGVNRTHINFRALPALKQRLEEARAVSGLPMSHEVEQRLLRSFEQDDLRQIIREEVRAAVADALTGGAGK